MVSVLFVCLGNICRSPMAEAVFVHTVKSMNLESHFDVIDSAGTAGYHVGEHPDSRSISTCRRHNVPVDHRARQFTKSDLDKFDWVLCMDDSNLENVRRLVTKSSKAQTRLFGEFASSEYGRIIEDPYYGGPEGFERNFEQVEQASLGFLRHLKLIS